jgi:Flp pilus assembly pilin Flp
VGSGFLSGDALMSSIVSRVGAFLRDEAGTETLEWGLVCGLIVVGAIAAITAIGPKVTDMWNDINNEIPAVD